MSEQTLRIVTYNIHKGFSVGNLRFVLRDMRRMMEQTQADIVFLQEIQGAHRRRESRVPGWPSSSQLQYLADRLWPHHAYGKNAIYRRGHHGNAILSKHPFAEWENINVSRHPRVSRSILHGVLSLPGNVPRLHTVCIHFGFFAFERRDQLNALLRRIESHVPPGEPLLIAGDFNDWQRNVRRALPPAAALEEVFRHLQGRHARSYPAWFPVLPLDRIYYRGLTPLHARVLRERAGSRLSDHLPLYAEVRLPGAAGDDLAGPVPTALRAAGSAAS